MADDLRLLDDELDDWVPESDSSGLAQLSQALFDTTVGKLRKAVLNKRQSVALARAWAFAEMYDIPELSAMADMLADTTVSLGGKGLDQMVKVMAARMEARSEDESARNRLGRNLGL